MKLEDVKAKRPMTHDLLASLIDELGGEARRVVIRDLIENTFFAWIEIETSTGSHQIDSRPSDALALALRLELPIFVREDVLERARNSAQPAADEEQLREWFDGLDPDDFGKYTM